MAAGRNPWRQLVQRAGLPEPPYVVALRPDPGLADREKKDMAARLSRYETQLAERLGGGDVQQALAAFSAEQEAKTAELTARDQAAPKPRFVSDPPLTLDDVPFEQGRLANGVPLVRVHFDTTPFTDVAVAISPASRPRSGSYFHFWMRSSPVRASRRATARLLTTLKPGSAAKARSIASP
jgi:hypothetical protein